MSRTIRFAYVKGPRSRVQHMAPGRVEGDITRCGLVVALDWKWKSVADRKMPTCVRCRRAS